MKIIKRNGSEVKFDIKKIVAAMEKANATVDEINKISEEEIYEIAGKICSSMKSIKRALTVEEIQDMVETELMERKFFALAKNYIIRRWNYMFMAMIRYMMVY